ncbi:MAG: glycosyltransferase [Actinomycetes bacterium]
MSTFLFVTVDAGGNVPPAVEVGRVLLARGHRVRFLGHERQRGTLTSAGFEFCAFRQLRYPDPTQAQPLYRSLAGFLHMATHPGPGRDLVDVLAADPADVVVIDCMLLSVLAAAQQREQAHAVLFHTFYSYWESNFANGPVGTFARLKGLSARTLWDRAGLRLVLADRKLDPAGHQHSGTPTWCGVTEHVPEDAGESRAGSAILVSLSTLWVSGQVAAYQRILRALEDLPLNAVVTTGPSVDPADLVVPPNVEVLRCADHARLMPRAAAIVTHGGHSTTMRALVHGLPLLLIPMHPFIDQSMVSQAVARAGAGIILSKKAAPDAIRDGLLHITGDEGYRTAARLLGARLRQTPGATLAADHLLAFVQHHHSK